MAAPTIHHLDCGTMCPRAGAALGLIPRGADHLVDHCLLIEAGDRLVLVDTGFGPGDIADPRRLGASRRLLGARLDPDRTAAAQIRSLGMDPADVSDVLITHLDLDHAGGLSDFPQATVHVHRTELAAARGQKLDVRLRYRPAQWAHNPRWAEHEAVDGEAWMGFPRVRPIDGLDVEIAMIPLPGHTAGHTGVAVRAGEGWLLHAGDAYLHHGELASPPQRSTGLTVYHRLNSVDERLRRENLARVADLAHDHADEVTVFCAHDPTELRARQSPGG